MLGRREIFCMPKLISIQKLVSISNKGKCDLFTTNFMTSKSYEFKILKRKSNFVYGNYF